MTIDLGQEAWLRYRRLNEPLRTQATQRFGRLVIAPELAAGDPTICATITAEYKHARRALLGDAQPSDANQLIITRDDSLASEHFRIDSSKTSLAIAAADGPGALYGLFRLIRYLQEGHFPEGGLTDGPKVALRLLNHWDNVYPKVDIERGYGGDTLFRWDQIAAEMNNEEGGPTLARLRDYARLLASVGINGIILNNVNVGKLGSQLLRSDWLPRLSTVARIFRAWGIRIGVSISYSAPKLLGECDSADPRKRGVREWWQSRCTSIYELIPDCIGFLVKADSEGQPGPMDFDLDHAQGAQHLADALAPHGGRLFWRAFVYGHDKTDIMAQPYRQFKPLDGHFADNVTLQVKNGPRDFQVREPVHPLIGAMQHTPTAVELQITQEYLGHDVHVCFLPAQWEEVMRQPAQEYDSVADFLSETKDTALVGVANTNDSPNWTGHLFAQANLFGFAKLAWNPHAKAEEIAQEWASLTFDRNVDTVRTASFILLESWPTLEGYTAPFCLGQLYNQADTWDADHFDPAPWRNNGKGWFLADNTGVGIDRSPGSGSGLIDQYPNRLQKLLSDPATCPEDILLFFHHLPWDWIMKDGKTLIQAIYDRYHDSAARVDVWIEAWEALHGHVDPYRHGHVLERLQRQRIHARLWARYMTSYLVEVSGTSDASARSY